MELNLTDLPNELLGELLYNLKPKDILNVRATSKSLLHLIIHEYNNYIITNYLRYYNTLMRYSDKRNYVYILKYLAKNKYPSEVLTCGNNYMPTWDLIFM